MNSGLDRYFETLFLLAIPKWDKTQKEAVIEEIDNLGLNGRAFYSAHFPAVEQYYLAFQSERVDSEGARALSALDRMAFLVYATVLCQHERWFQEFDSVPDEIAQKAVKELVLEKSDNEGGIVDTLESEEFTDQARWQIMSLIEQPKQKLKPVIEAVCENIVAFEFACSKIAPELETMLGHFEEHSDERNPSRYVQMARRFDPSAEIKPTLASPLAALSMGTWFYGLLLDQMIADKNIGFSEAEIIFGAKALSDSSKLEILLALKDDWLYSLEIAKRVGLTPATISHHMSTLLSAGLVTMEKRDGKVYYRLSDEGVNRFLDGIKAYLL